MGSPRAYLLLLTGREPHFGITVTLAYGSHAFVSAATDTPPDTWFEPRLANPGLFSQSIYSPGATGGGSSGGYGIIELINTDGGLDALVDYAFDGRSCTVLEGPLDGTLADFATVISGTVEQLEHQWGSIVIRFKDRTLDLDRPLATAWYTGGNVLPNGLEGGAELAGKPKPRAFGVLANITPVLVNTSTLSYQVSAGAVAAITAVRDNGVALVPGTNHATSALLQAATVASGTWQGCLAEGYIRLGSAPTGQITADVVATYATIGQTMRQLAIEQLGAGSVVEQSIIDLDAALPDSDWGYFSGTEQVTVRAVLDILAAAGIWWGFDNCGRFWAKQFGVPSAANPLMRLDRSAILSIERTATADSSKGVPVWRVAVRYGRNYTVQPTVAGSVAQSLYAAEWRDAVASDSAVRGVHPLAAELAVDTPYSSAAAAQAEADRQLALRSVRRDRIRVTLPMQAGGPLAYPDQGYWDDEAIGNFSVGEVAGAPAQQRDMVVVAGGCLYACSENGQIGRLPLSAVTGSWQYDVPSAAAWYAQPPYTASASDGTWWYLQGSALSGTTVIRLNLATLSAWDDSGISDLPATGTKKAALFVHGGYLYVLGGTANICKRLLLSAPTGGWSDALAPLPSPRVEHSAVVQGEYVYVIGGNPSAPSASVLRWHLSGGTAWEAAPDYPGAIADTAATSHNGGLTVSGGTLDGAPTTAGYRLAVPDGSAWEPLAPLPYPRTRTCAVSAGGSLYSIGGITTAPVSADTWRLRTNDNPADYAELSSIGRTVLVTLPRYGYSAGRPMRIIGYEADHASRTITLELWG